MIPRTIHYCWFGESEMSDLNRRCLESWEEHLPGYRIKRWDEGNSPVDDSAFVRAAVRRKEWGFAADYVRLHALHHEGGVYLDTDMLLLGDLDDQLHHELFLGAIGPRSVGLGIVGSVPGNEHVHRLLDHYRRSGFSMAVNTGVLGDYLAKLSWTDFSAFGERHGITIYPQPFFYPYTKGAAYRNEPYEEWVEELTIGVHLWESSWIEDEFVDFWWDNFPEGFAKVRRRLTKNPLQPFSYYRKLFFHLRRWLSSSGD